MEDDTVYFVRMEEDGDMTYFSRYVYRADTHQWESVDRPALRFRVREDDIYYKDRLQIRNPSYWR